MTPETFEKYLQELFIGLDEIGGVPITKDNCEDLFDGWLESMQVDDLLNYATGYGKLRFLEGQGKGLDKATEILKNH